MKLIVRIGIAALVLALAAHCSLGQTPAPEKTASTKPALAPVAKAAFAGGCFWCMQGEFEELPGVKSVIAGYTGGTTPHPTYEQVSSGSTGHFESIDITYDPRKISYEKILDTYWHNVDPFTPYGQFCDNGPQYRTAIFVHDDAQRAAAEASKAMYQEMLTAAGYGTITTEIVGPPAPEFYFAEDYHQQYLDKNPYGYCPNHSTGVKLPADFEVTPLQYVE